MDDRTCNRCNTPLTSGQKAYCSHACANITSSRARAAARAAATPWATCEVDDCDKPSRSRVATMCPKHYHRLYRYGSLETCGTRIKRGEMQSTRADLRGARFGTLTVIAPDGQAWLCQCDCGETRTTRIGDLRRGGDTNTCGIPGRHLSDDVDYSAAHGRVRRLHGSASNHRCITCGDAAQHWSYDHTDPDERISPTLGVAYSLNPDHYQPRCVSCHKRYDLDHINSTLDLPVAL